jgi:hypothetical protein
MPAFSYRGRRAVALENEHLRVVVTAEGGHIAAIVDKATGVNPLWSPPWPTIEPSTWKPEMLEYGSDAESQLLAGILGHNLCLDTFGGPSPEEAAAGLRVHGETGVIEHDLREEGGDLLQNAVLQGAQLRFNRRLRLPTGSRRLEIEESVENLAIQDRPIAWTEHVTIGPPFLERGRTVTEATATRSKVVESDFTDGYCRHRIAAEFDWPFVPLEAGGVEDLRVFTSLDCSGSFTTHLMDPALETVGFQAWSPTHKLLLRYDWRRSDFPWLGMWEENHCRAAQPWGGETLTRGLEFGASPFAETRRSMIDRRAMFETPCYRWIPARTRVSLAYTASLEPCEEFRLQGARNA